MKRITRIFSIMLIAAFIISLFPVVKADAAEKKYKLSLTGEYDLGDEEKVIYNYSKMLKNIKLEKVEGKNQWNLTMYAGTTVVLPYLSDTEVYEVECESPSYYVSGNALYNDFGGWIKVTAKEKYGQNKTLTNKVLTCKAYNESGKSLSTLKLVVTILPYSAKMERTKLITAEELYKIGYLRDNYSDFAWEKVIGKYKEVLLEGSNSPLYVLADHVTGLAAYEKKAPQYLYDEFGGKDIEELLDNIYEKESDEMWGYDEDLIRAAGHATTTGYNYTGELTLKKVNDILLTLDLEQYDTDWQKVLEIQKWVKANIKYKVVGNASVKKALETGYAQCAGYAQIMLIACQMIGVPCYIVDDPDYMGVGHAWNIVLVDGMWCTMDLTGEPSFGVVDCQNFKNEPSLAAYEELQLIFGGKAHLFGDGLVWSCIKNCWEEE